MITIYHNPRCRKSREALSLLQEKEESIAIREYLKDPPSKADLSQMVAVLGIKPHDLVRKGEEEYKEHYKGRELSDSEWLDAMIAYPKLIERPIVINKDKAVIGRPPENVLSIL